MSKTLTKEQSIELAANMKVAEDRIIAIGRMFGYNETYESYSFDEGDKGIISVTMDDYRCGSSDYHAYQFPAEWLALSDEEVGPLVAAKRADDERKAREWREKEEVERKRRNEEATEKAERSNYERLKAKFEPLAQGIVADGEAVPVSGGTREKPGPAKQDAPSSNRPTTDR